MRQEDFFLLCMQLSLLLGCAFVLGGAMRRLKQPAVIGEMMVGVLLGPTLLGTLFPDAHTAIFGRSATANAVRDAAVKLGMMFFLFRTGLEVNLAEVRKLGAKAVSIGLVGTFVPLVVGVGLAYALPRDWWGAVANRHFPSFALFVGMSLANSANPVIARILMDLGLLKTELGRLVMTATVVDDLVNWVIFAIILADISPGAGEPTGGVAGALGWVVLFFVLVFVVGRLVGPRFVEWIKPRVVWPTSFIVVLGVIIAAVGGVAEKLGVHAFLGAFLVGVVLGTEEKERNEAHEIIGQFVFGFFVPLYFAGMALTVDLARSFDPLLTLVVLVVACGSKLLGVTLGARLAGMPADRHAVAVGFGLNARGATGMVLAKVGFDQGMIDERVFVAMLVMCVVTSLVSGPAMTYLLKPVREPLRGESTTRA